MLLSHGGLNGVRLIFLVAINEVLDESQTISGISKLDNFEFIPDSLPVGARIASTAQEQSRPHLVRMQTVMGLQFRTNQQFDLRIQIEKLLITDITN